MLLSSSLSFLFTSAKTTVYLFSILYFETCYHYTKTNPRLLNVKLSLPKLVVTCLVFYYFYPFSGLIQEKTVSVIGKFVGFMFVWV